MEENNRLLDMAQIYTPKLRVVEARDLLSIGESLFCIHRASIFFACLDGPQSQINCLPNV
jgi:hypothetical protein